MSGYLPCCVRQALQSIIKKTDTCTVPSATVSAARRCAEKGTRPFAHMLLDTAFTYPSPGCPCQHCLGQQRFPDKDSSIASDLFSSSLDWKDASFSSSPPEQIAL